MIYKKRLTVARGTNMTITVTVAVLICSHVPILAENMELSIPIVSGFLRMIMNVVKQKLHIDLNLFLK